MEPYVRTRADCASFPSMTWPFLPPKTPFGMAHRGGRGAAPENTQAAFAHAVELGYKHVETDVHLTSDGEVVAFHDVDLERVAGVDGDIAEHTWDEIAEIELEDGHRIPRMEELLVAFPDTRFNIDPKADEVVEPLADLLFRLDAVSRVCIGSFSESRISRMRTLLGPDLCTSPGPKGMARVMLATLFWPKADLPYGCLQIPTRYKGVPLDHPWLISRLHSLGLQVHYWTINDRAEMERLIEAGADGLISDEVDLLKDVLIGHGVWPADEGSDRS